MSLTGKPPQDLCLSNLAVSQTVVAPTVSTLNVSTVTVNGISTVTRLQPVRRIFDNAEVGSWSVSNGILRVGINGVLNGNPITAPKDTTVAYLENYDVGRKFSFPAFVYCPQAGTIAGAGFMVTIQINQVGEVSVSQDLLENDIGRGDGDRQVEYDEDFD